MTVDIAITLDDFLPVLAAGAFAFLGAAYGQRSERQREAIERRAQVEYRALTELQEAMVTLPRLWTPNVEYLNQALTARRWSEHVAIWAKKRRGLARLGAAIEARDRVRMLSTRIVDDTVRTRVQSALDRAFPDQIDGKAITAYIEAGEPVPYDPGDCWDAASEVVDIVGSRLRLLAPKGRDRRRWSFRRRQTRPPLANGAG